MLILEEYKYLDGAAQGVHSGGLLVWQWSDRLSDSSPPTVPFTALEVAGFVGNCTDGTRPFGDMTAVFGSVFVRSFCRTSAGRTAGGDENQSACKRQEFLNPVGRGGTLDLGRGILEYGTVR